MNTSPDKSSDMLENPANPNASPEHVKSSDVTEALIERANKRVVFLGSNLHKPSWLPSRAHAEADRNVLRDLASALEANAATIAGLRAERDEAVEGHAAARQNFHTMQAAAATLEAALSELREALSLETEECAQVVWDIVGQNIDATPNDGINAEGDFNLTVLNYQQAFTDGLRSARLAAFNAIRTRRKIG